ncbi:MAG: hypothetical protein ABFS23_10740 [Pseudomonadota bacterium]
MDPQTSSSRPDAFVKHAPPAPITLCGKFEWGTLSGLTHPFGLQLHLVPPGTPIPGSFWGEPEAGLIADALYVRSDTPVHSMLHEAVHYICMDSGRRRRLHTDAGGDVAEENAVCYLQILLADYIPHYGRSKMMRDMDAWGYSFRLGSAHAWFTEDAEDARDWLTAQGLIGADGHPTWKIRL